MKLKLLFALLIVTISNAQTQIGGTIVGTGQHEVGGIITLSADGTTIAVSNHWIGFMTFPGKVSVYRNISGNYIPLGNSIDKEAISDGNESTALSADGNTIAIGAPFNGGNGLNSGHARVYKNVSGTWIKIGNDIDGNPGDLSGSSVSLSSDGNTLAVSAPQNDNSNGQATGCVRVYKNISGNWTKIGNDIIGKYLHEQSGYKISLSSTGDIVAISTAYNKKNGATLFSGQVRIYQNISGTWTQIGNDIDGDELSDENGLSISLSADGSIVAIGAPRHSKNGFESGLVRVFKNISGNWVQVGNDIYGKTADEQAGASVSLSANGDIVAIGVPNKDGGLPNGKGAARIYKSISGNWIQIGNDFDGTATGDAYGISVSLSSSGNIVAIGASTHKKMNSSGYVKVFDISNLVSSDDFVLENFNIYPNPTTDILNIELDNSLILEKVLIYNTSGQLVKEISEKTINLSGFAKGIYNVQVITNQGEATRKVVVK